MDYIKFAQEYAQKFDFYLVALVFTLTGLSVQTAKFDGGVYGVAFELLGWIALLLSGVLGLKRLSAFSIIYQLLHRREIHESSISKSDLKRLDDSIDSEEEKVINMYKWCLSLMIGGIICIMISRALAPISSIITG